MKFLPAIVLIILLLLAMSIAGVTKARGEHVRCEPTTEHDEPPAPPAPTDRKVK